MIIEPYEKVKPLEKILGYEFNCKELFLRSLVRKNAIDVPEKSLVLSLFGSHEKMKDIGHQEALETLGDSVLYVYLLEDKVKQNKEMSEKDAQCIKTTFGTNEVLHQIGLDLKIQNYVFWGKTEENQEIWLKENSHDLADCLEAIIGAIFLDGGMKNVRRVLNSEPFSL